MTFNDFALTIESEINAFDKLFNQCVMFAESSYQEYKTNLKEAELKVIQESGTEEDLIYLESEAKEGFIVRSSKTIKKIIDSFLDWIKRMIESVQKFINKESNKKALDRAEKIVKDNPKLKNVKMEVQDIETIDKVCGKYEAKVDRKLALFKANKFDSSDIDELDEINKDFDKDVSTAKKSVITLSIAAVIGLIAVLNTKLKKQESSANSMSTPTINVSDDPKEIEAKMHATSIKVGIMKERTSTVCNMIKDVFKSIRGALTKSGEIDVEIGDARKTDDDVTEESTIVNNSVEENIINESTYLDNLFKEIEDGAVMESVSEEVTVKDEKIEESVEEVADEFDANAYLESVETELFGESENNETEFDAEEYLESMESDLFSESDEECVTAEEYLEAMEAELFSDEDVLEESEETDDEGVTAEEYLESMEAELFE